MAADGHVIVQLLSESGEAAGPQLDLPQSATPEQLDVLLNKLLGNEDRVPYAFFLEGAAGAYGSSSSAPIELAGELGAALRAAAVSVESVLKGERMLRRGGRPLFPPLLVAKEPHSIKVILDSWTLKPRPAQSLSLPRCAALQLSTNLRPSSASGPSLDAPPPSPGMPKQCWWRPSARTGGDW